MTPLGIDLTDTWTLKKVEVVAALGIPVVYRYNCDGSCNRAMEIASVRRWFRETFAWNYLFERMDVEEHSGSLMTLTFHPR